MSASDYCRWLVASAFFASLSLPGADVKAQQNSANQPLVILNGKVVDHDFHIDHKNPIPNVRPWRSTPRDIAVTPLSVAQGSAATIKVSARRGFDRFHKITLNGKEVETRFLSPTTGRNPKVS
ncbi:MAG TPA: hypothetical protein VMO00_11425 [Methylomirabilota bacterium]|nr:hypothetical protein [Methylomirabilota bacterium]